MSKFSFFLGGDDAEMRRIAEILKVTDHQVHDAGLGWGAKASDHGQKAFFDAVESGFVPVLIELEVDCDLPAGTVVVDHHNERSSEPASVLQVLTLLGIGATRRDLLIAANDCGYIPAMVAMGATDIEIASIRAIERDAAGVTPEMEIESILAISAADAVSVAATGEMVVVRMDHSKTSTVSDRLFPYWKEGFEHLLILSGDGEINFFGDGALCAALKKNFEGWAGKPGLGKKGEHAFWGGYPNQDEVLDFIKNWD